MRLVQERPNRGGPFPWVCNGMAQAVWWMEVVSDRGDNRAPGC